MRLLGLLAIAATASALAEPSLTDDSVATDTPQLEKRWQKVRLPKTTTTTTTSETPKPWVRTISSTIVEIVTPTVIEGVTFSAKPNTNTDYPQPWVSLNKFGSPKTINPKVKNQKTQNASPTYSTYFQTAVTHTYDYEELKAHNMEPDATHEEIEYIDEDKTYVSLNPLIRCTPDRYKMQGHSKDVSTEPFCSPDSGAELPLGKTYFITWYTRYFPDEVKNVRLHFSYVKENRKDKGMKRDIERAFFTTEWVNNVDGFYPFEIEKDWLLGYPIKAIGMTIQPDTVSDEEFDLGVNATIFRIAAGNKVAKKTKEQKAMEDEGIQDETWLYVAMSIPCAIAVTALGMYIFLQLTSGDRDFSETRLKVWRKQHRVLGKFKGSKNKRYSELPQFDGKGSKLA